MRGRSARRPARSSRRPTSGPVIARAFAERAGATQRCIAFQRLAHASRNLSVDQRRTPAQPRRQVDEVLAPKPRARAGKLLGAVEQTQAAFAQGLIAAGQADERPGVAWA